MILTIFVSDSNSNQEAFQEENREEDESEEEVGRHVPQGTIKSYCFTYIIFRHTSLTTCQTIPLILIENIRKTSTNHFSIFIMILTIFVSDPDSNQKAFQEENREEDESEEEVDRHVPQGTIKSYCFTYINFSTYQFDYLPNDSTDTYRKYSENIRQSFQNLYNDFDNFCFRFRQQ